MAGQKNNVVTYVFEGNVLSLEQSIKKIKSLLSSSMKSLKEFQEGTLTATQKNMRKQVNVLLKTLKSFDPNNLTKEQAAQARAALSYANKLLKDLGHEEKAIKTAQAKEAVRIAKEKAKAEEQVAKEAAEHQLALEEAVSTHGRQNAEAHAMYLETTSRGLAHSLGEGARNEISIAIDQYREIAKQFDAGIASEEELLAATEQLQGAYENYNETLRTLKNTYINANKGIKSFNDLVNQSKKYIETMLSSMGFWIQLLRRLMNAIKQGIEDYSDYVESLNFLEAAAGSASKAMLTFAKTQALAFGMDPTEINEAAAAFYSFAESMSFTNDQSTLLSQNLTKLSMDLASLHNTDIETAMSKLRSAIAGQSRALAIWGINVTDANMNEWLLSKGINKTMNQMNEASQAAARYAFIIEQSSYAQDDLARTLQSPANQLKILRAQLKLFVQNIGSIFTTVLMPIVKLLNNILTPINQFFQGLTSLSAEGFTSSIGDATESTEELGEAVEDTNKSLKGLTSLDELNQFDSKSNDKSRGGIDEQIATMLEGYDNMASETGRLASVFRSLGEAMAPIWDMLNNGSGISMITYLFEGLGLILTPIKLLFDGLSWLFNLIPEPIRNIVGIMSELAMGIVAVCAALAIMKTLMASKVFTSFIIILKSMWTGFIVLVKSIWAKIAATKADSAATATNAGFTRTATALSLKQRIANWWETASWWAKAAAIIAASTIAAGIVAGIVLAAVAAVGQGASQSDSKFNGTPQGLATGGIVTGPKLALIGEGQYDEAVIPLGQSPQFTSMKQGIAEEVAGMISSNGRGRGSTANDRPVILNIDGKTLARAMWPNLINTQYQVGVKLK